MSRVYPFSIGEAQSNQMQVWADGVSVPLHISRVSAYPINRRWPGHQRSIEETELAPFALLETDGKVEMRVKPRKTFHDVVVRPLSRKVETRVENGEIFFTLPGAGQYTLELDGSHNALHIFADPVHEYDVSPEDENTLYFARGIHDAGVITMKAGQTLYIEEGAVVYGRIEAKDAHGIRILGHGILDASRCTARIDAEMGEAQREAYEKGWAVPNAMRWNTIDLHFCDNVEIHGITIRDSLIYNIRPVACRHLNIENVKIIGSWRYNSDGIDMHNCEDVHIRGCFVRTFDDCLCVKGFDYVLDEKDMLHNGEMHDMFTDTVVENCVMWCDWGRSLEIGAETRAKEICRITFRNCDLIHNDSVCCDVQNVDYARVHDVLFEDIRVEYPEVSQRPHMQQGDADYFVVDENSDYMPQLLGVHVIYVPEYSQGVPERGVNRDITFRRIAVAAPKMPPSAFTGYDETHMTQDVTVEDLTLNGEKVKTAEEARFEMRRFTKNIVVK